MSDTILHRLNPSTNGTAAQTQPVKAKRPAKATTPVKVHHPSWLPSAARWRLGLTLTMGVTIPLLSLGLSHVGGTLCRSDRPFQVSLGLGAFAVMACVLVVSLSHLAWAVENITRSPRCLAWLLAIAFDLALVLGELVHVSGAEETGIVTAIMLVVCVLSMVLNCWAFLKAPATEDRRKKAE